MHGRPQDLVVLELWIEESIRRCSGNLPRDVALVWKGDIAAPHDQQIVSEAQHDRALALLRELGDDPTGHLSTT